MKTPPLPDWGLLRDAVAAATVERAEDASERLRQLAVPHAVIGGLAVGAWGFPRATKDADLLVGNEAFSKLQPLLVYRPELAGHVRIGFLDLLALPENRPVLAQFVVVPEPGEVPIIPVEALAMMKLDAFRPQDKADVHRLLDAGSLSVDAVVAFLGEHASDLVPRFLDLVKHRS